MAALGLGAIGLLVRRKRQVIFLRQEFWATRFQRVTRFISGRS